MEYHQPTRKLYPIRQLVHADAIDINAGNVTLDLNGFSILDALVCSTGSRSYFHFKKLHRSQRIPRSGDAGGSVEALLSLRILK